MSQITLLDASATLDESRGERVPELVSPQATMKVKNLNLTASRRNVQCGNA